MPIKTPIHPGKIFFDEYIRPRLKNYHFPRPWDDIRVMSLLRLKLRIDSGSRYDHEFIKFMTRTGPVTGDLAIRIARLTKTTPRFWMNLQATYSIRQEENYPQIQTDRKKIRPLGKKIKL